MASVVQVLKMRHLDEQKQILEGFRSELTTLHIAELMQTVSQLLEAIMT